MSPTLLKYVHLQYFSQNSDLAEVIKRKDRTEFSGSDIVMFFYIEVVMIMENMPMSIGLQF